MRCIQSGSIVESCAGKDKGTLYVVIALGPAPYCLVADGRQRTMKKQKRKNLRHLHLIEDSGRIRSLLREQKPIGDEVIRDVLNEQKRIQEG